MSRELRSTRYILLMLAPSILASSNACRCSEKIMQGTEHEQNTEDPYLYLMTKSESITSLTVLFPNLCLSVSWEAALPAVISTNIVVAGLSFSVSESVCPPRPDGWPAGREALARKTLACSRMGTTARNANHSTLSSRRGTIASPFR
jgi:hypothetical protein